MKTRAHLLALCAVLAPCAPIFTPLAHGANLTRSTLTEVVKDVTIINPATRAKRPAKLQDVFAVPDVMRTGPDSRAEMVADDQTVTRVGANTVFSFQPEKREINLEKGSVLFNAPSGKGGGTVRTAAATAAVLGTTLIVVTTPNGGFKVLLIEGTGKVTSNGQSRILNAGQMTFVLPGQQLGPVYNFQLKEQVGSSKLLQGFKRNLPSQEKIQNAIAKQEKQFSNGRLEKTGLLASNSPNYAYQVQSNSREVLVEQEEKQAIEEKVDDLIPRFLAALSQDAVISSPILDAERIFLLTDLASLRANASASDRALFAARNTTVNTPLIDLTEFTNDSFQFLSTGDLAFARSVQVLSNPQQSLRFTAGGTITAAKGTVISLNNIDTRFSAFGNAIPTLEALDSSEVTAIGTPITLANMAIQNNGGALEMFGPSLSLTNTGLAASTNLSLLSPGNIDIQDNITALPSFQMAPRGTLGLSVSTSPVGVPTPDTSFTKRGTGLEAGDTLLIQTPAKVSAYNSDFVADRTQIDASTVSLKLVRFSNSRFDDKTSSVSLRANDLIQVSGARFQVRDVSMQARTVVLNDMSFAAGSRVVLASQLGVLAPNPNTGAPPVAGKVNFINGVNYGASPAQSYIVPTLGSTGGILIKRY